MSSLTTSLYSAAMRSVYEEKIREQVNNTNIVTKFRKQQKDDVRWQGNEVVVHLHSARNYSGVRSTGESGLLGVAGNQGYAKLSVPIRDIKGRFGITAEVINASETAKGAAAPALTREMEGLAKDIERQLNRQLFGYGTGTLALASSGAASATQAVNNPGGVAGTTNPTRFIQPGMYLAFTATDGTNVRVQKVSSVNSANSTVTLAASLTSNTGDIISIGTVSGSTNAASLTGTSTGTEMMGLLGIVDQTTYLSSICGLDRSAAANSFFRSGVYTSVGNISEDFLYRIVDNQNEISGEQIDTFFCHPSVRREYYKLTQADRRYTGADLRNPDAGVDLNAEPVFGERVKWVTDKDAPYGTLIGAASDHLFVIYMNEGQWEDFGGRGQGEVLRFVADKTDYEGVWYMMLNAYSDRGNAHLRGDGVTATVTSGNYAD